MIKLEDLTLKYRSGKGISHVSFSVGQGNVMGYLGPNGAGKTTTIRCLMGFMKPDSGACAIGGLDCFHEAAKIKQFVGYIPGEIAFPSGMTCREYLQYQAALRGLKHCPKMDVLMERFALDPKGSIKRFSKGMKQKVAIIAAFMHDPQVLILDEPTSGLDPLMQNEFIRLVQEEKKLGKTILISSHIVEEVERTCDHVVILKQGQIAVQADVKTLTSSKRKGYSIRTTEIARLKELGYPAEQIAADRCIIYVNGAETPSFFSRLSQIPVLDLDVKAQTLEDIFLHYYGTEGN